MKVKQFQPYIGDEEYQAIKSCFDINWITEGPKSKEFSEKLLELMDSKYGVFAQNGTLALYLGLRAIDVGPGDEVIVPDFTFIASANAVEMCGAKPVFVDINIDDLQINVNDCERVLTKKTKAIMPVHLFGLSANMDEVMGFAHQNNLKVVEDACQAIGIKWNGKHCGTFGDVGCFSFFADKTITTGEGGFVVTNDEEINNSMMYLRNQGRLNRGSFVHPEIGYNFRITDIHAAIGLVQLNKLGRIIERKLKLLQMYKDRLKDINGLRIIEPNNSKSNHVPFRVVIMCEEPVEDLMKVFEDNEIETRTVFYPLHKQPCYLNHGEDSDFPNSIYAYEHGVCLPSYPELEEDKVNYICDVIRKYFNV
jgi:perosamine synthetase